MISLFVYSVAAFGFAYIIGHSKITLSAREYLAERSHITGFFVDLVECPSCSGFWCGVAMGLVMTHEQFGRLFGIAGPHPIYDALIAGLYTCGSNFFLGMVTGLVGKEK